MGKHFPLDLSKFKKVSEDAHQAVLSHPDGHQITIAKKPLSAKMRGQIAGLAMADGGPVPQKSDAPPEIDKQKAKDFEKGFNSGDVSVGQAVDNVKKAFGFADGGKVADSDDKTVGEIINYPGAATPSPKPSDTPKMADGGDVQEDIQQPVASPVIPSPVPQGQIPQPQPSDWQGSAGPQQGPAGQVGAEATPEVPPSAQTNATSISNAPVQSAATNDVYGNEAYNSAYMKGLNEQKAGLRGEATAAGQQGATESKALQSGINAQQAMQADYQKHFNDLQSEYQNFQKDVQNQHIDPQHYLNSMGTGQKVRTAIGLILGGMGGGLTHQGNPVLDFLNRNIANDIAAQKANLGKSENLLNANLRQFGNIHDATQMTYAMQQGVVANQLRQAAAQTTDTAAKARALQAAGQLDQAAAPVLSQIAMKRTLTAGANQGMIPPENVIRAIVPAGEQAAHYKELQTAQNMVKSRDNLLSAFDQVAQLNTVGNRLMSPVQTARQINAISEPLLAQLVKDSEGRITPQDTKMISGILQPGAFDSPETKSIARNQLNKFVSEKMNFPMLKAIGINPESFGRYNQRGQSKIQESAPNLGK